MRCIRWMIGAVLLSASVAGLSLVRAQAPAQPAPPPPPPPAGTFGQRLDSALGRVEQGAATAEAAVQQGFANVRAKIDMMGTEGRVYGRLRWDKALADWPLSVQANGQVVTLIGTVPNEAARQRAVTLARETVGVDQVIDHLSLAAKPH